MYQVAHKYIIVLLLLPNNPSTLGGLSQNKAYDWNIDFTLRSHDDSEVDQVAAFT
jgi:hypothetical protein